MAVISKKTNSFSALMTAALSLPGLQAQAVNNTTDQGEFDYSFARYSESGNRMKIDVHQASIKLQANEDVTLKANVIRDTMTGASPVFNRPSMSGEVVQVVTRATIKDVRDEADVGMLYTQGLNEYGVNVGTSNEDDYDSVFGTLEYRRYLNNKNTSLSFGISRANDRASSVVRAERNGQKSKNDYLLGISQLLDKQSLLQANLSYSYSKGYLTDPYKVVFISGVGVRAENRPEERKLASVLFRYVRALENGQSSLHLDYRYSRDNWGIRSHMLETSWVKPLTSKWSITPRLRYYSQTNARFYEPFFTATPASGNQSSDYRLATFGAVGADIMLSKKISSRSKLLLGAEYYDRSYGKSFKEGTGTYVDDYSYKIFKASYSLIF